MDREKQQEEENRFRVKTMERVSQALSERCRSMLNLRERQEKSYIEIARTFKVPIGTVMSQLARCREALKRLVENEMKGGPV